MSTVGQRERATQDRVVKLFRKSLGYDYLGKLDHQDNRNIIDTALRSFLERQGYTKTVIDKALFELNKVAGDQVRSLYDLNQEVYTLLRYGVKVKPDVGENNVTVWLIDWKEPLNNDFAIAEEVAVKGKNNKRPDVAIYVNGIALGVLELKRSVVSVSEGIRQNIINQKPDYIRHFFTTMQLVMAGSDTEGYAMGPLRRLRNII
ncbi:hypothetical protein KDK_47350 [Dictyobacter kobayashii]|uniref:type I site-specific deoxyribonuclease n=1 Tax=Dictyobacter kobayashii TaxID=2014872 RepID=A0A402API2_9CHLR|nr:type I restriction endonuclease [Dictyobacter kobayashii]GCE20935.1 hypothetical protein KDK_47350 [Dictyobacter kobayashii]